MNTEARKYLAAIGRKGGQKSRRKLTQAQARAMVRARTAKRAAIRPDLDDVFPSETVDS